MAERGVLEYIASGDDNSEAVLLLHGIGSRAASWLYQLEALSDRFRVIAWNAPGYGGSTPLAASQPTAGDYAAALKTLYNQLGIQRAHLVGQSLGAIIAVAFTRRYASQVSSLSLLNPARGHGGAPPAERQHKLDQRLHSMAEFGPVGNAERRAANQLSPQPNADSLALARWNLAQLNPSGYAQAAHLLANSDLMPDLAALADSRLKLAVQVLSGTADRIVPSADARCVADGFAHCDYHLLPALGHAAYLEGPQLVNRHLSDFFHAH